jgi:peptidoglycan/LPS O-acetylase OafA/YrhL
MADDASSGPGAPPRDANNVGTLRLLGALAVLFGHSFVLGSGAHDRDPISDVTRDIAPYHLGLPGLGVSMFFVISGYLVTQSYKRRGNLVAYAEARLLRIYPALIVAVAATIVLGLVITTDPAGSYITSRWTISYGIHDASLFHLRWTLPGVFESNPLSSVNGSLWTLPAELRMYVLVALAGVLGAVGRRTAFNLLLLAIIVVGLATGGSPFVGNADQEQVAVFFLAGAALFANRESIPFSGRGAAIAVAVTVVASFTAAYPLVFAFAFAYVILWIGLGNPVRLPNLAARGDFSYGAYLYAFPVTQLWIQILDPGSPWVVAALTFLTVMPLAMLSWHLVERSALRRKGTAERWLARWRGRSTARAEPAKS